MLSRLGFLKVLLTTPLAVKAVTKVDPRPGELLIFEVGDPGQAPLSMSEMDNLVQSLADVLPDGQRFLVSARPLSLTVVGADGGGRDAAGEGGRFVGYLA